jgi:hypothetical protein
MDNTLPVSALEPHQDIFIWRVQEIEEMNHHSHLDYHLTYANDPPVAPGNENTVDCSFTPRVHH